MALSVIVGQGSLKPLEALETKQQILNLAMVNYQ